MASSKTAFPNGHPPYQTIALTLLRRIERAVARFCFSQLALIVESSTRANPLANRFLGPFDSIRVERQDGAVEIPILHFFAPKSLNEPGLEIADFIMHAVGGQARVRLDDPSSAPRKDFAAVMHSVSSEVVEYISIDKVETKKT